MLGEWTLGAIEFTGTAAVVNVLGYCWGCFWCWGRRGSVVFTSNRGGIGARWEYPDIMEGVDLVLCGMS